MASDFTPIPDGHLRVGPLSRVSGLLLEFGCNPAPLLKSLSIPPDLLCNESSLLPLATACELLDLAARESDCEHFGLLIGSTSEYWQLGASGKLMAAMPTIGMALDTYARLQHLRNRLGILTIKRDHSSSYLRHVLIDTNFKGVRHFHDMKLALSLSVMGLYAGIPEISVSPAPVPPRAHPGR